MMGTALGHERGCWLKAGASAYVFTYAVIYVAAAVLGMRSKSYPPMVSMVLLFMMAGLCMVGLYVDSKPVRIALVVLWGFASIANWMKIVDWTPVYSDLQYTVMALMNMGQSISIAIVGEVWTR